MEFKDYYKILGVSKTATTEQIKKEYRKLARKYHPDISKDPNAEKIFKEIGEANEVLKDPEKRKLYDQYGSNWKTGKQQEEYQKQHQQQHQGAGFDGGFDFGGGFDNSREYSDFFENMFGNARRKGSKSRQNFQQRGEDIDASISIPVSVAYKGETRMISFTIQSLAQDGRITSKPKNLNIKIPKGIKGGQKIRLAGQGSTGYNGGENGDLYIKIEFEEDRVFSVKGADVYVNVPVAPWEAALGGEITIPTPEGNLKLKLPANSSQGKKLRLKGKGIPAKSPGDLYVTINIALPPADTEEAKKMYEQMKNLNFNPRVNFGG